MVGVAIYTFVCLCVYGVCELLLHAPADQRQLCLTTLAAFTITRFVIICFADAHKTTCFSATTAALGSFIPAREDMHATATDKVDFKLLHVCFPEECAVEVVVAK